MEKHILVVMLFFGLLAVDAKTDITVIQYSGKFSLADEVRDGDKSWRIGELAVGGMSNINILTLDSSGFGEFERWRLWQLGFRESSIVLDGIRLQRSGRIYFVRAPFLMEDAWKEVNRALESSQPDRPLRLTGVDLFIHQKSDKFFWEFMFSWSGADGGMAARFDLRSGKVELEGRP